MKMPKNTYYITTNVFLKAVSFIYFVAFLTAYNDWDALLGENGLTPANLYVIRLKCILIDKSVINLFLFRKFR